MTFSYGGCEIQNNGLFRSIAQQANAQGITFLVSSGDSASATCDRSAVTPEASKGATVSFPASIPEVTAVGGTEFNEGAATFWSSTNTANGASAISYIPERVWNDTAQRNRIDGGGGGASQLFTKPYWQIGPGVPADNARDLPDVSFSSSAIHDGYEVYTSGAIFVFGGTSVASPVFAGMLALLNQAQANKGVAAGLGNINPALYRLAQSNPDIFHDITVGDSFVPCAQGSPNCVNGVFGYRAGPGYDLATGLGSIDAANLIREWKSGTGTTLSLGGSPSNALLTDTINLSATVSAPAGVTAKPSGTVTFLLNDAALGTSAVNSSGAATFSVRASLIGPPSGMVSAVYSGDANFAASFTSAKISVAMPSSGSAVVPALSPSTVNQIGGFWVMQMTLSEKAGVATTLTAVLLDGSDASVTNLFSKTTIAANGSIVGFIGFSSAPVPSNHILTFTGKDADGKGWSVSADFTLLSALPFISPAIVLGATPATVAQDPQAAASCAWSHVVTLQEQGGFLVTLSRLTAGASDLSSSIQQIFGTTRLAAYGSLHGTLCWSGLSVPATNRVTLSGFAEDGTSVTSSATVSFTAAPTGPLSALTASPTAIKLVASDAGQTPAASIAINFASGTPTWSASITPSNRSGSWLKITNPAGSGSGQLSLSATATGLSNGVYSATVLIQSASGSPSALAVPVTLTVGPTAGMNIDHVANAASFKNAAAPGMLLSVFGSGFASGVALAPSIPLPLTMLGTSATVNGVTAPLYYVSDTQLNIQVPYETGAGIATLGINNNGKVASYQFPVSIVAPGIFADGTGALVPSSSGRQGQVLLAFITGEGDLTPTLATGATTPAGTPLNRIPAARLPLTITVGGIPATVAFAGVPLGLAGVTQINFTIPPSVPVGVQPVVVTVGGVASSPVSLAVLAAQ
jgi:uncharacterized protein (TIGR03437 family)